jgi:adenine-specific DNA-methyltransferase
VKEPSVIEQKAYRDTWGKGLDSYLKWFYETVVLLRELLADDGSLYVHLDWRIAPYAKAVLDEVFGEDNFQREVIWYFDNVSGFKSIAPNWIRDHETIFWVTKSSKYTFKKVYGDYPEGYENKFSNKEEGGRRYMKRGGRRQYLDELKGKPLGDVWRIPFINNMSDERVGYPTQKPEVLLDRIIQACSKPSDLVLDCFCGSGTTAAVAEKLGRRWITCDLGRFAIHTARKRFLAIDNVKPFVVQNLGKYERQQWQQAEFGDNAVALTQAYREFILSLYGARPIHSYVWLHGIKSGHMVHVGSVDAPISVGDVAQAVAEFKRSRGTGADAPTQNRIDILGWDFAFELNEVSKQQAAQAGVEVKFVRIPREVLEKKAVEQGDIKFFELAALSVDVQPSGKGVILTLKDFVIPLDDVPQEIQAAITHWEQWIDYWAVDWDNKGDTFHNQWQSYRTRKDKGIQKVIASPPGTYPQPGDCKVVVKVIDILGNDTTKTLKVQVK